MMQEFEMIKIGMMTHFLDLKIILKKNGIFAFQNRDVKIIFKKFKMKNYIWIPILIESEMKLK